MNHYQENLGLLKKKHPTLASQLQNIDSSSLKLCESRNGSLNLLDLKKKKHFHSSFHPEKEADKWFNTLSLKNPSVLYIYGIGLGSYYYRTCKEWLHASLDSFLVFIEDDLRVLKKNLECEQSKDFLQDPQVLLFSFESDKNDSNLLQELSWSFVSLPRKISSLFYYRKIKEDTFAKISQILLLESAVNDTIDLELSKGGHAFFRNFYKNCQEMLGSFHGNQVFGKFSQVPALICGAGPSLEKQSKLLKALENRALIFSGGSSMQALDRLGIQPHFGAGVDPHALQSMRVNHTRFFSLPFFYRNRFHNEALQSVHGPKIYIHSPSFYSISDYFERHMQLKGPCIEDGLSVSNLCMEIAQALGCNPIIFVGMDLGYTKGAVHTKGVFKEHSEEKHFDPKSPNTLVQKDIFGKPIHTHWKFLKEAQWVSSFAKKYPQLKVINATEGGLGFPLIENTPLKIVFHKYLHKTYNFTDRIHTELQSSTFSPLLQKEQKAFFQKVQRSLERCLQISCSTLKKIEKEERNTRSKKSLTEKSVDLEYTLSKENEPAFQHILQPLHLCRSQREKRLLHSIENSLQIKGKVEKNQRKLQLYRERAEFFKLQAENNLRLLRSSIPT